MQGVGTRIGQPGIVPQHGLICVFMAASLPFLDRSKVFRACRQRSVRRVGHASFRHGYGPTEKIFVQFWGRPHVG